MVTPKQAWRLFEINRVLVRHGLDEIIFAAHIFRPLRYFFYSLPWNWFRRQKSASKGERIRRALEDLGPIFVKFGQIASTRRDLLPKEIADELAKLQDNVPPFPTEQAKEIIASVYGDTAANVFAEFKDEPLASASVAQVYAATLKGGEKVVVKIIRPGIEKRIQRDLSLMKLLARMAERYSSEARRLCPREVVADYERTVLNELDMKREAANISLMRRNFTGSAIFSVPEVHWPLTNKQILVMERIKGINIGDIDALQAASVNMKKLAERGVEIFFSQVFVHNFFHADMHPGNIFVDATEPENPRYIGVDFGIVGTLSDKDRRYLAENFLAFFNQDYRRVAQLHIDSGWASSTIRVEEFEDAIRTVCEPVFEKPLKEISFGRFLLNLFQTARQFDLHIQPQLVLLQKTLLNIEGLGRQLYPDLDLWATAKPFLEKAMRKEAGFESLLNKLPGDVPAWVKELPHIPAQLVELLRQLSEGRLAVDLDLPELKQLEARLKKGQRRNFKTILGSSLLICAAIVSLNTQSMLLLAGLPLISAGLGVTGLLLIASAWSN